ncbi:Putative flippase GtrA (transmembrane translocase of bactoprenol-linked glucose) [Lachnospiraceae bacterium A10]|nr:Putative flippase GtrA (transmembrane translocase of bactoprenol-linked glucose) [Lachnospiraceae bacterium A10]
MLEKMIIFLFDRFLKRNVTDTQVESLAQFIKFGIVGVSNTVVNYLIYLVSLSVLSRFAIFARTDYLIAQVVAFVLSVLWSFYWNNRFVFVEAEDDNRTWWKALFKTYVSYAFTGLFLNTILSLLWIEVFHISKLIAPIINLLVSVPVNFILNKFWAFKSEGKEIDS